MSDPNGPTAPSLNIIDQIEAICREFRAQWKQDQRPRIEACLERISANARATLFRNLLHTEIEFRRRAKQNPTAEEYIQRFPKFAGLIRQAFFMSTMMSMAGMRETPADEHTVSFETPAANQLGDYQLIRELGRGGFGVVYEARHLQRRNLVALKTLPIGEDRYGQGSAERLHKFRREFRSLADINHPNLVGMQTLETDGGQWFFTMDLIDGEDFISFVRPNGQLDEPRLRSALPQLVNGIMALHGQHIIHRDLKPSNVLVDSGGKVTILDFGLVIELAQRIDQTQSMQPAHFAGTPVYAAPEQIIGESTSASDWYALGIMLYESLSGERPFSGAAQEVFEQKRHHKTPSLVGRSQIPDDLAELTVRLMQGDPGRRADALEIAKVLSLETLTWSIPSTDETLSGMVGDPTHLLIGRDGQLSALEKLQKRLLIERQPLAVFITGRSGEGKTSLAEKFLQPLRRGSDVLVLSGRCYDRETVPFKALDSIIDSLVAFLRGRRAEDVVKLLPNDTRMLAHLFPVLGRVEVIAELTKKPIGQLDSKQIRHRAFAALRELLKAIGLNKPIVMFIDDLQWGDLDSASALFQMLTSDAAPAMLFVGSYRRDEADQSPFLQEWERLQARSQRDIFQPDVVVGPLSESQCVTLVVARIGIDNQTIRAHASEIYQSTGGNPYFLDQLIDCFNPDTGSFRSVPLDEVIQGKLSKLPADALPLLKTIAVSGRSLAIGEASQAAGQDAPSYSTLTHMRNERLVRLIGAEDQGLVDTYHDKIRETVLGQLQKNERCSLHLALGETIESVDGRVLLAQLASGDPHLQTPARVFDLAYHFTNAGQLEKSLVYSILAAECATGQFALPVAIDNYQTVEKQLAGTNDTIKYRVKYGFGSVLLLAGDYASADKMLAESVAFAQDQLEIIRAKSQQADILYKTGSLRASIAACEPLLKELGLPVPNTNLGKSFGIIKSRALRLVHGLFGRRWSGQERKPNEKTQLAIKVLLQYAYPCLFCDRAATLWATSVADDLAEKNGDGKMKALTAAFQVLACSWHRCDFRRAKRHALVSIALANELNDIYIQALASFHWGTNLLGFGRIKEAMPELREALQKFDSIGDVWRKTFTLCNIAFAQRSLGNFIDTQNVSRHVFQTAVQFGQHRLAQFALTSWIDSTGAGLPLQELKASFEPVPDDLLITSQLNSAESRWHLKNGQTREALQMAEAARQDATRLFSFAVGGSDAFPTYAHALRAHAQAIEASHPSEFGKFRRQAFKAARQAVRITRRTTYRLPYALRELALNYLWAGKTKKAYKHIVESCAVAKRQDAKFEYAKSLLVCGQIGEKLGQPEGKQQIQGAETMLAEMEKEIQLADAQMWGDSNLPAGPSPYPLPAEAAGEREQSGRPLSIGRSAGEAEPSG